MEATSGGCHTSRLRARGVLHSCLEQVHSNHEKGLRKEKSQRTEGNCTLTFACSFLSRLFRDRVLMRRCKQQTLGSFKGRQRSVFHDGTLCESGKEAPVSQRRSRSRLFAEGTKGGEAKEPPQGERSTAPLPLSAQVASLPIQRVRWRSSLKGDKLRDAVSTSKLQQDQAATRLQAAARGRLARKLRMAHFAASEQ